MDTTPDTPTGQASASMAIESVSLANATAGDNNPTVDQASASLDVTMKEISESLIQPANVALPDIPLTNVHIEALHTTQSVSTQDPTSAPASESTPIAASLPTPGAASGSIPMASSIGDISTPTAVDINNAQSLPLNSLTRVLDAGSALPTTDFATAPLLDMSLGLSLEAINSLNAMAAEHTPLSLPKPFDKDAIMQTPTLENVSAVAAADSISSAWPEIMTEMLSELGFHETSRMMAAEQLVQPTTLKRLSPGIIAKHLARLGSFQKFATMKAPAASETGPGIELGKHDLSGDELSGLDPVKRRRIAELSSLTSQVDDTREGIRSKMEEFMAQKRDQINQSNIQEFIQGSLNRVSSKPESIDAAPGHGGLVADTSATSSSTTVDLSTTSSAPSTATPTTSITAAAAAAALEDETCARVAAVKLNRTTQMKLDVIRNEDISMKMSMAERPAETDGNGSQDFGLDERLRNIQTHLNLRLAANPPCSIAERITVLEDVIMQLERDYPPWAAVHFNQPNRVFPPPPSVTTVSRNSRNQIVITGEHLPTSILQDDGTGAQYNYQQPSVRSRSSGMNDGGHSSTTISLSHSNHHTTAHQQDHRRDGYYSSSGGNSGSRSGSAPRPMEGVQHHYAQNQNQHHQHPSQPQQQQQPPSQQQHQPNTVLKLKRPGGSGGAPLTSSLSRAVQEQVEQRKKAAASGLLPPLGGNTTVVHNTFGTGRNNGDYNHHNNVSGSGSNTTLKLGLSSGPAGSYQDNARITSVAGAQARGPIKSRRKSLVAASSPVMGGNVLGSIAPSPMPAGTATDKKAKKAPKGQQTTSPSAATPARGMGLGKGKGGGAHVAPRPVQPQPLRPAGQGLGLGKGKGGGTGFGMGKGKGGDYHRKLLSARKGHADEQEEEEEDSDEELSENFEDDFDDEEDFVEDARDGNHNGKSNSNNAAVASKVKRPVGRPPGRPPTKPTMIAAAGSTAGSAPSTAVNKPILAHTNNHNSINQNGKNGSTSQPQVSSSIQHQQTSVATTATTSSSSSSKPKPPPVRKFGGKSFGMAGGESSASSSDEEGQGSGSSGSQSNSSDSSSGLGSETGGSDSE